MFLYQSANGGAHWSDLYWPVFRSAVSNNPQHAPSLNAQIAEAPDLIDLFPSSPWLLFSPILPDCSGRRVSSVSQQDLWPPLLSKPVSTTKYIMGLGTTPRRLCLILRTMNWEMVFSVRFDICPVIRKMLIFGEECEKAAVRFSKSLECGVEKEEPPPQLTQFQARFSFTSFSSSFKLNWMIQNSSWIMENTECKPETLSKLYGIFLEENPLGGIYRK